MSILKRLFEERYFVWLVLLATLLVYIRLVSFGPISWDDPEMVFGNRDVRNFDLLQFFSSHYVGNYLPFTMLVHALGWLFFKDHAGAHHLINLAFHLVNGYLVFLLGKRLFGSPPAALTGMALFLLHPLQVETVAWVAELKNVLAAFFMLLASLFYLAPRKKQASLLCFIFFVLACLSKSSAVVFPLCLLAFDLSTKGKIARADLVNKTPYFLVALIFGIINLKTQAADQFINYAHQFPWYQRPGFAGYALLQYLVLFLFPLRLSVIYPFPSASPAVLLTGYAFWLILAILLYRFFKTKNNLPAAAILFILANLVLVLQFIPFGEVLYADRYMYLPLAGFGWLTGLLVQRSRVQQLFFALVITLIMGFISFQRSGLWRNAITLYEDIVQKYPRQFIALNSAGVEMMRMNEDDKALAYFNRATGVAPRNYKGFYNKGLLQLKNNQAEQALASFNKSLALYDYHKAYAARASAYHLLGKTKEAISDAEKAIKLDPENPKAYFVLGNIFSEAGRLNEAMNQYNTSIALKDDEPDFYFKRAITRGKMQKFKECIADLDLCLQLNPGYYEAWYWKGVAKVNLRQDPCEDFRIAARHNYQPAISAAQKYCR